MNDRRWILDRVHSAIADVDRENGLPDLSREGIDGGIDALVHRFIEEVEAVSGVVHHVPNIDAAARELETLIRSNQITSLAVSRDPLARAISSRVIGQHEVLDPEDNQDAIAEADMGLTGARLGISEHGTLMLAPEDDHGRLAALLPPHHVAILATSDLVGTLSEALARLGEEIPPTITFVSGPSRTADIEQTLVIGIHGPARVDIILVDDRESGTT